jgi:hypothetical protein
MKPARNRQEAELRLLASTLNMEVMFHRNVGWLSTDYIQKIGLLVTTAVIT